jgi:hypothetical protein
LDLCPPVETPNRPRTWSRIAAKNHLEVIELNKEDSNDNHNLENRHLEEETRPKQSYQLNENCDLKMRTLAQKTHIFE